MNNTERQKLFTRIVPVFFILLLCFAILQLFNALTRGQIEENRQQSTLKIINEVLPLPHDNDILQDKREVEVLSTTVYRARVADKAVGLVFFPLIVQGYSGRITLALGLSYDGVIQAVRIIEHHETEGLGDAIHQDISPWVYGFTGRSLTNMRENGWAVQTEGGDIDAISGATISPRMVINRVKNALDYYVVHREELYQ